KYRGEVQNARQLNELRRLKTKARKSNPTVRAVHFHPDDRRLDEDESEERHKPKNLSPSQPFGRLQLRGKPAACGSNRQSDRLDHEFAGDDATAVAKRASVTGIEDKEQTNQCGGEGNANQYGIPDNPCRALHVSSHSLAIDLKTFPRSSKSRN